TVTITLSEVGGQTAGVVATELSITGKPAQFGRGMIADVGGKIIDQFATCLSEKLVAPVAASEPATAQSEPEPEETEPLDLVHFARSSALKRVGPLIAAAMLVLIVAAWLRRLRSRA
ncbi:MAG TPA: carbon monoxide dehydrogenase, partial [Mycobacterium sp.]|nr:carbon monoxide dehydrogenase [Mycobacterium sp.]